MNLEGSVKFKINDTIHTVTKDVPADTSLNAYIRNYANLKGTKFMCLEGGCGACIVAVRRKNLITGLEEIFSVNSCLVSVFSCHGWTIFTVEGIGNSRIGYDPVQSALACFSGTQCGYCSPGMVMNMFSLMNGKDQVTMSDVENSFGGNLCRCTGYRPILDAFKSLASDATPELKNASADIEDIMTRLKICSKTQKTCNKSCTSNCANSVPEIPDVSFDLQLQRAKWFRVKQIQEIYDIFNNVTNSTQYMLLAGNTAQGVYRITQDIDIYIDLNGVRDLHNYTLNSDNLVLGANLSLTKAAEIMDQVAVENADKFAYFKQVAKHISWIAGVSVRNIGTLAGNLSIKYAHREFPSDLFLLLEAIGAKLTIGCVNGIERVYSLEEYLAMDMHRRVILNVTLPALDSPNYVFNSYKIMQRAQNTHAYVNAAFLIKTDKSTNYKLLDTPSIVIGGINANFIHARETERYLEGKNLLDIGVVKRACEILKLELHPDSDPTQPSPEYRTSLAVNLFYKFVLSLSPHSISSKYRSGGSILERPLSSGRQDFQTDQSMWPVGKAMPKMEAFPQCAGESQFVNDIPDQVDGLCAAFVVSKKGPGKLINIDVSKIENMPGVVKFLSAKDIPGKNSCVEDSHKVEDEELFAEGTIMYAGQPVGVVIAKSQIVANKAADQVIVNVEMTEKPALDLKAIVDTDVYRHRITKNYEKLASEKKDDIKYEFSGSLATGGQYHFTMETQTCYCVPVEDGMDIYPSSQWIAAVQHNAAVALNMPDNSINVSVKRLGGGFGGKDSRSTVISTACAVAAYNMKVPVRMVMKLETNMQAIGKRMPMYGKYNIAVNERGEIQYLNIYTYSDIGCTNNDPFFGTFGGVPQGGIINYCQNGYDSSTWNIIQYHVRTDRPSNTYARAPGGTEGKALVEFIMDHIAAVTNLDPVAVRLANCAQSSLSCIPSMIDELKQDSDFINRKILVEAFNNENRWKKRGISLVTMNYPHKGTYAYHALVSIYAFDGTIAVSHGGIEMGQGLNTKVAQACAHTLGVDVNLIKIKPSNSLVAPNDSPTTASRASDGVTYAAIECCKILLDRLEPIRQKNQSLKWPQLVATASAAGVDLCSEFMYSPKASYAYSYDIYGVTISEVEVDLLTGQYQILRVDLLEDVGNSINPSVDVGQLEGAFVMGLGLWLSEKLIYDHNTGALLTDRTWNYTPPGAKDIPIDFRVYFRKNAPGGGVLRSKAIGEPAVTMSIGVVYAIRNALLSGRQDAGSKENWFEINLPYTPENVYLSSMTSTDQFAF